MSLCFGYLCLVFLPHAHTHSNNTQSDRYLCKMSARGQWVAVPRDLRDQQLIGLITFLLLCFSQLLNIWLIVFVCWVGHYIERSCLEPKCKLFLYKDVYQQTNQVRKGYNWKVHTTWPLWNVEFISTVCLISSNLIVCLLWFESVDVLVNLLHFPIDSVSFHIEKHTLYAPEISKAMYLVANLHWT